MYFFKGEVCRIWRNLAARLQVATQPVHRKRRINATIMRKAFKRATNAPFLISACHLFAMYPVLTTMQSTYKCYDKR